MQNVEKRVAAEGALQLVRDGMTLGLGTGSTVAYFLKALSEKGLKIRGVPTSERTATQCRALGIELLDIHSVTTLDLTVDGADEVDHKFRMIKGGGGALLREKLVAEISQHVAIIIDSSKLVDVLGDFPLPVEVVRFGYQQVERRLKDMGVDLRLRFVGDDPYTTDNGHYILDCRLGAIGDPDALAKELKAITGIVDTGLFLNHCDTLIIGKGNDLVVRRKAAATA